MTNTEYNYYRALTELSLIPEDKNPLFIFSSADGDLLLDVINGGMDLVKLAKIEIRNRGIDASTGRWVGWNDVLADQWD